MKKFFGILAIAGVLVACDNTASETTTTDSTNVVDSTMMTPAAPVMDSTMTMDSAAPVVVDTTVAPATN